MELMLCCCFCCFWQDALKKYDVVLQNLEFVHDVQKQFQAIAVDVSNFVLFMFYVRAMIQTDLS